MNTILGRNKKMKVLFLTPEFDKRVVGGLGTVVNGISLLLSYKITLDVMYLEYSAANTLSENNVKGILYTLRQGSIMESVNLKDFYEISQLLKHYDILHFFHYSPDIAGFIRHVRENSLPVKIVFSCHYLLKYEQNIRCIYNNLLKIEQYIYEHVDCVHVLNQTSYQIITECYPVLKQKAKLMIIPNGVENYGYAEHYTIKPEIKPDDCLILTVSRWCHGKGLECLLDAVPLVLDRYPHVKFIIGGRKEFSWEHKVQEYVKKIDEKIYRFKDNVFSLGWLTKKEIGSLMKSAALWVLPSELEYFPYGLLEPMIYKVPIITARFNGFSEIIEEGKECLAFPPGDACELAEKIIYLLENQPLRNKLSVNAYHKAAGKYNWHLIAEQYFNMYRVICK